MASYGLNSPFDIELHKKHFVNYLEILILKDGTAMYAVPSHQELAIRLACEELKISRDELLEMCPDEMKLDFMNWLLGLTGTIAVWRDAYMGPPMTQKQEARLKLLKMHGLYRGSITRKSIPWPDLMPQSDLK